MSDKPDRWKNFLDDVGQGVFLVLVAIAVILLYKGLNNKPIWPL